MEASSYGFGCNLNTGMEEALRLTTEALKQEGFGVLTTIDVQAVLKAKLGVDRTPYVILGACNPNLSNRALQAEPELGLLLPCNVIVYDNGDGTSRVSIIDPHQMMGFVKNPTLDPVADEAAAGLRRVVESLKG